MCLPKLSRTLHFPTLLLVAGAVLATSAAAAPEPHATGAATNACPKTGARVLISAAGKVTMNGTPVPVENLAASLNALAPRPSEVCYFRENPKGAPPASVQAAVSALISTHLPISFYSDASFSKRVSMPTH